MAHRRGLRTMRAAALPLAVVLPLAACQKADNEPGPGGVTVGEARALDRAAAMIEDQAPPDPVVPVVPVPSRSGPVPDRTVSTVPAPPARAAAPH